ncbi:hypothetical protein T492DRAFT_418323 [Pavlovales sp. CCMP2436]|nr:hypothetical protein T492DRAFT_418323 [Pavlovales sp. CCMP2436]
MNVTLYYITLNILNIVLYYVMLWYKFYLLFYMAIYILESTPLESCSVCAPCLLCIVYLCKIHRHARWRPSQRRPSQRSRLRHAAGNGQRSAQTSTTFRIVRRQFESLSVTYT